MKPFNCIVTVGPSSLDNNILSQMRFHGADCFRINLSHSNIHNIDKYVQILSEANIVPSIDTQGAQGRITNIEGPAKFLIGEIVVLNFQIIKNIDLIDSGAKHLLTLNHNEIINQLSVGDIIRIDFSGLILKIESIDAEDKIIIAAVISEGACTNNRAFDIASKPFCLILLQNLIAGLSMNLSNSLLPQFFILASCEEDVSLTRSLIPDTTLLISKIENKQGLKNIEQIAQSSDGLLVDRGDLSREISISMIPSAVNLVLDIGLKHNTPVYIATNVLDSMMSNSLPSRAEISDMHNLFKQGVAGMVLAAEAAIGDRP